MREYTMGLWKKLFGGSSTPVSFNFRESASAYELGEALSLAVHDRDIKKIRALLAQGADPNRGGIDMNAVQVAAYRGYDDALRILLKEGGNPNGVNEPHNVARPLQLAAAYGHIQATKLLLKAGAQITGSGALQWARDRGHQDVVELLLIYQRREP
jgi:ankyrin repeat protein